jgi:hypothetical protein
MDTQTAIKAKPNLRALAVVKLIPPYASKATDYEKPTFDNPVSNYRSTYYLKTHLAELWLYVVTSGKIYAKVKPNTLEEKIPTIEEKLKQKVWIRLKNDALIEVDEVTETTDGVFYTKGSVTVFLERDRIKSIVRKPPGL